MKRALVTVGILMVFALALAAPAVAADQSGLPRGSVYGEAPGEGKFHSSTGPVDFVRGGAGTVIQADATTAPNPIHVVVTSGGSLGAQAIYSGTAKNPNAGFAYRAVGGENPQGSAAGAGYGPGPKVEQAP